MEDDQPRWPQDNPVRDVWEESYPFAHLASKIERLNLLNEYDKLEALETLLQITDIYAHLLATTIRNPHQPWEVVAEDMRTHKIMETLEELQVELPDGEGFIELHQIPKADFSFNHTITDEWEGHVTVEEMICADFLGCPAEINQEDKEIEFLEDPEEYIACCNATINFWHGARDLLNDFKHGYRILPFDWNTVERFQQEGRIRDSEFDIEERKQEFEEASQDKLFFWRLETNETDEYTQLFLSVYETDPAKCLQFARLIWRLLHNLFGRGGSHKVVDEFKELIGLPENESLSMFNQFMAIEMVWEDN